MLTMQITPFYLCYAKSFSLCPWVQHTTGFSLGKAIIKSRNLSGAFGKENVAVLAHRMDCKRPSPWTILCSIRSFNDSQVNQVVRYGSAWHIDLYTDSTQNDWSVRTNPICEVTMKRKRNGSSQFYCFKKWKDGSSLPRMRKSPSSHYSHSC